MFWRETLSMQTCLNIVNESPLEVPRDFLTEEYQEKVEKAWNKQRNKNIEEALFYKASLDNTIKFFQEAMKKIKPIKLGKQKQSKKKDAHAYYVIADLHYWRTTERLYKSFESLVDSVEEKEITLIILWDLFESPILWGMHDSQAEEMDIIWVDQVVWCMNLITLSVKKLFEKWVVVRKILGLTWNHDRVSRNKEADPQRIVGILGYTYLKKQLEWLCPVVFDANKVLKYVDWDINFILHHGDNGFNAKSSMQILHTRWEIGKHNLILSWHYHIQTMESGTNYTRIIVPSMNEESQFEKHQFITKSKPWYLVIKEDGITFRNLPKE